VARRLQVNINQCLQRPPSTFSTGPSDDASSMTAYQSFRVLSHGVLGLMSAGIVYAAYIAITYWTGISV
jgi:hypothetical protein